MIDQQILQELIQHQLNDVPKAKQFTYADLEKLAKYLESSIFGNKCTGWLGYANHDNKYQSITIFFKSQKKVLHRLLYENFVGSLVNTDRVKFSCGNRKCCNVKHMVKCRCSSECMSVCRVSPPKTQINTPRVIFVNEIILRFD